MKDATTTKAAEAKKARGDRVVVDPNYGEVLGRVSENIFTIGLKLFEAADVGLRRGQGDCQDDCQADLAIGGDLMSFALALERTLGRKHSIRHRRSDTGPSIARFLRQHMSNDLHIGDIAGRTGRSVHTIRWYEAQGLMPGVTRDRAKRRVYTEYHVGWLDLMERLRCTGMSIAQMRAYTELAKQGAATLRERRELLRSHRTHVQETIARWRRALTLIDAKIEFYDEWVANGKRPTVSPHRRIGHPKRARG
jgi:DNA-binding transcriptional MerR regulator